MEVCDNDEQATMLMVIGMLNEAKKCDFIGGGHEMTADGWAEFDRLCEKGFVPDEALAKQYLTILIRATDERMVDGYWKLMQEAHRRLSAEDWAEVVD